MLLPFYLAMSECRAVIDRADPKPRRPFGRRFHLSILSLRPTGNCRSSPEGIEAAHGRRRRFDGFG